MTTVRMSFLATLCSLVIAFIVGLSVAPAWAQSEGSSAEGSHAILRVEEPKKPVPNVYLGIYLHDISQVSISDGTYEIDADMWAKWSGEFDPDEIRFANAIKFNITGDVLESDGDWHSARWTVRGTFRSDFPVHNFPLDKQYVRIAVDLPTHLGELIPDLAGSGVSSHFSITDWSWAEHFNPVVTTVKFPSDLGSIAAEGVSAEVKRVSFEIELDRPITPLVLKLFLPLAVLTLIVFLSLFVTPDNLQPRLTMCVTGLVACFAFQFSVNDLIPSVPYLTLANALFIIVYILAVSCVLNAVFGHVMVARGKRPVADRAQRIARYVSPVVMAIAVYLALPAATPDMAPEVDELPITDRKASARDLLRIGTTSAIEGPGSPISSAVHWGLTRQTTGLNADPVYVERIPRVDSGDLRFLSDGTLEVVWTLREGAKWSDGTPMVTRDITLPLETQTNASIHSWREDGARRVVIRYHERVGEALRAPRIWPSAQMLASIDPSDDDARRSYLRNQLRPSAGPYRVTAVDGNIVRAERNPHFPLTPAAIATIEVHHFEESSELRDAITAGRVDVATPNSITNGHVRALGELDRHVIREIPSAEFSFLALPLREGVWTDKRARLALLQSLDRQALVQAEWPEHGAVAHAPTPTTLDEGFPFVTYDPEAAKSVFEELGLTGSTLTIRHGGALPYTVTNRLVEQLQAVGFEVELVEEERIGRVWRGAEFSDIILHRVRIDPDAQLYRWWGLRSIDGAWETNVSHGAWTPDRGKLVERHRYALIPERRAELRRRILNEWGYELPMIPLFFNAERIIVDRTLENWERDPRLPFGFGIENWRFVEVSNEK